MSAFADLVALPFAHRGLHDVAKGVIENSPEAFKRAMAGGYAIECDLQLTSDNIPMVIHDSTLDRVTERTGRICDQTSKEISTIPLKGSATNDRSLTFAEFLALVGGKVPLAIELKPQSDGRDVALVRAALAGIEAYQGPLTFISFSPTILQALRQQGFTGATGVIVERFVSELAQEHLNWFQRFTMRHMLHFPKTRFDFVDADQHALDLPAVRVFKALGFPLAAWTIRSQEEADAALTVCDQIAFEGFIPHRD